MYYTDTSGDGVDLESPQGLGSDIPTIPEVNVHVHLQNFLITNPIPEDKKPKKDTCYLLEHLDPCKGSISTSERVLNGSDDFWYLYCNC